MKSTSICEDGEYILLTERKPFFNHCNSKKNGTRRTWAPLKEESNFLKWNINCIDTARAAAFISAIKKVIIDASNFFWKQTRMRLC